MKRLRRALALPFQALAMMALAVVIVSVIAYEKLSRERF